MEFTIYWNDITPELQEQLLEEGFIPESDHLTEQTSIGMIIIPEE